jgi:hypothetical protein
MRTFVSPEKKHFHRSYAGQWCVLVLSRSEKETGLFDGFAQIESTTLFDSLSQAAAAYDRAPSVKDKTVFLLAEE